MFLNLRQVFLIALSPFVPTKKIENVGGHNWYKNPLFGLSGLHIPSAMVLLCLHIGRKHSVIITHVVCFC